tara:strand:- start:1571 stop:1756 length:186 start_codon:yes stop_codon:yes gene_type:complete
METFKPLTTSSIKKIAGKLLDEYWNIEGNRKSYKVYLTAIMDIVEKIEIEEDIRTSNKGVK